MVGVYYWLPKWTGHMYNMTLAKTHFWLSAVFVNVLFFPQHFLGLAGMPRRIPDFAVQFTDWNIVSSIGGVCVLCVAFPFFLMVFFGFCGGRQQERPGWVQSDAPPRAG